MFGRFWLWLALTFVNLVVSGLLALFVMAYASAATGIGADAREIVVAGQTALWSVAVLVVVIVTGRLLGLAAPAIGALTAPGVLALLGVLLAFIITAESRSGGVLDVDRIGPAVFVPACLVSAAAALYARGIANPPVRRGWSLSAKALTVALAVWMTFLVVSGRLPGPLSAIAGLSAVVVAIGLVTSAVRGEKPVRHAAAN